MIIQKDYQEIHTTISVFPFWFMAAALSEDSELAMQVKTPTFNPN